MKKFIITLFLFAFMFSFPNISQAQHRLSRTRRTNTESVFRFSEDMLSRVARNCPKILQRSVKRNERLEGYCSVRDIDFTEADLGPWQKAVSAFIRLFQQFRRFIYVGAVFMLLWIFVKAAYEGEMKWMHIAVLIIGVVILAFAEVLINLATGKISVDDVVEMGIYVDCRNAPTSNNLNRRNDAYYKCNVGDNGYTLYDSRYFLQISGEMKSAKSEKFDDGLF